jgi:proline iminopeptidase
MQWDYARIPLAERELTMAYLEPAGTGRSGRPGRDTVLDLPLYVGHLHAVIEQLGGDPVFVLGHGHGGHVAQSYALSHPGRMAGLVLYSTSPVADARTDATTRDLLRRYAVANSYAPALAAWDRLPGTGVVEATRRMRHIFPAWFADYWRREPEFEAVRERVRCWPAPAADDRTFDVRAALPSITTPTLIIAGAHDVVTPPDMADQLHVGIPGSRLVMFQESGHLAHLEEAERFSHLLLEFTHRISGPYRAAR